MTTFKDLKNAYQHAVETGSEEFVLDGKVLVTGYVKYLIEQLDMGGARNMQEIYLRER